MSKAPPSAKASGEESCKGHAPTGATEPATHTSEATGPVSVSGDGAGEDTGRSGADRLSGVVRPVLEPVRAVVRFLRHLPDRLLHSRRRRRTVERLGKVSRPDSVLFVCVGNICRSPYAERALRQALSPELRSAIELRSAGLGGWDQPSPAKAVAEAKRRGVDLTEHRSRVLTYDLVDSTDLFLVTAVHQARTLQRSYGIAPERIIHLGDLDPRPIRVRTVVDPWGKELDVFRRSYDRIDRCLDHLVRLLDPDSEG